MNQLPELDTAALKAKSKLIWIFAGFLFFDLVTILIDKDYRGLVRLVLTVLLMYLVLQGQKWAKWLVVIFASLGILIYILATISIEKMIELPFIIIPLFLNINIVLDLTRNKPLNRYFDYKRKLSSFKF